MAKTQDVITKFTKDQRCEEGKVVGYECENNILKILTHLTSTAKGDGDLKLLRLNDQKVREVVLDQQNVAGSRKICEYEIRRDSKGYGKLIKDLNLENIANSQTKNSLPEALVSFFDKECDLVHREIENIKACRTSLFMGTLGILGAAGIAILGIIGSQGNSGSLLSWLPWAAAIPVLLLTTAIITLIHKARGINERKGYLEAIEELKNSQSLKKMKGWILASSTNRRCKIFRDVESNPSICPKNKKNELCTDEAEKVAYDEINQYVKWWPDILNSFTSLCTYVYSFAYLISVSAFLWSMLVYIKSRVLPEDIISDSFFWRVVLCGGLVTGGVALFTFNGKYKNKNVVPQKVFSEYILKWAGLICFVATPLLLIGLIISFNTGKSASTTAMLAYLLGGVLAATAVFVGYSLFEKVNSLRRGVYSIDCWRHTWKIRFERCPLLNL